MFYTIIISSSLNARCDHIFTLIKSLKMTFSMSVKIAATSLRGYKASGVRAGGNSVTSPTSVYDSSPSVKDSLNRIRTFSCKTNKRPLSLALKVPFQKSKSPPSKKIIMIQYLNVFEKRPRSNFLILVWIKEDESSLHVWGENTFWVGLKEDEADC